MSLFCSISWIISASVGPHILISSRGFCSSVMMRLLGKTGVRRVSNWGRRRLSPNSCTSEFGDRRLRPQLLTRLTPVFFQPPSEAMEYVLGKKHKHDMAKSRGRARGGEALALIHHGVGRRFGR